MYLNLRTSYTVNCGTSIFYYTCRARYYRVVYSFELFAKSSTKPYKISNFSPRCIDLPRRTGSKAGVTSGFTYIMYDL
jgi:hypothetical protein